MNTSIVVYKDNYIYEEKAKCTRQEYFAVKGVRYMKM